jgi:acyl-CoA thioesterase
MTETSRASSAFAADTRVEPIGEHRYGADVTDRWSGFGGWPLGGYILAVALAALREDICRGVVLPDLQVASAFFLEPVAPGPVEVHTDIVRAGRRSAVGEARLLQGGHEALRAVATYTDLSQFNGTTIINADPPVLPPPDQAMGLLTGSKLTASVAERVDHRVAQQPGWAIGRPTGTPAYELWMRLIDGGSDDTLALAFLVDASARAILDIGARGSTTVELTLHVRRRPRPGWLACRATTRFIVDGCHEEDFEVWDSEGQLLAQSRQFARLR